MGDYLEKKLSEDNHWSANAISIVKGWIKGGLEKRCITRDLMWGTPVPREEFNNKVCIDLIFNKTKSNHKIIEIVIYTAFKGILRVV